MYVCTMELRVLKKWFEIITWEKGRDMITFRIAEGSEIINMRTVHHVDM